MPIIRRRFPTPGTSPGLLRRPAEGETVQKAVVSVFSYAPGHLEEKQSCTVEEAVACLRDDRITWIDVAGVEDADTLEALGQHLHLHPLALEDVHNVGQRPKQENYGDSEFLIMRLLSLKERVEFEQISFFLGKRFLLTIQETEGDPFEPVRIRIREGAGRIRKMGPDYLLYALIDALVDGIFPLLEEYGERVEDLQDRLVADPRRENLGTIFEMKKDLLHFRRASWPQREVIHALERGDSKLVTQEVRVFLRDCYDHAVQIMDIIETYRELVGGLTDLYHSSIGHRTNEIMRVLTLMASIFIPLTFIAGIYGMNFDPSASPFNMPELSWRFGYPAALSVMTVIGVGMYLLFRRKKWM